MRASTVPQERRTVAQLLGRMQNPEYSPPVVLLLDDPDRGVCIAAIEASGKIQCSLASHLLRLYRRSPDMREHLLDALGQMPEEGVPTILEAAIELLQDILPRHLASRIVQLVEPFLGGVPSEGDGLSEATARQLMNAEPWLRAITAFCLYGGSSEPGTPMGAVLTERETELYKLIGTISFLKKVPLFEAVPGDCLLTLATKAQTVRLLSGETLFHRGDQGDALYILSQGSISVQVSEDEVARPKLGKCIGEMAVIGALPRSATCVANEEAELLRVSADSFVALVKSQSSIALGVLQTLTFRLRQQLGADTDMSFPHAIPTSSLESKKTDT